MQDMTRFLILHPRVFSTLLETMVRAGLLQFEDLVEQISTGGAQVPPGLPQRVWGALAPQGWKHYGTARSLHSPEVRPEITKAGEIYIAVRYMVIQMRVLENREPLVHGAYATPPTDAMDVRCWPLGNGSIYLDISSETAKAAVELALQFWGSKDLKTALGVLFPNSALPEGLGLSLRSDPEELSFQDTFARVSG